MSHAHRGVYSEGGFGSCPVGTQPPFFNNQRMDCATAAGRGGGSRQLPSGWSRHSDPTAGRPQPQLPPPPVKCCLHHVSHLPEGPRLTSAFIMGSPGTVRLRGHRPSCAVSPGPVPGGGAESAGPRAARSWASLRQVSPRRWGPASLVRCPPPSPQ